MFRYRPDNITMSRSEVSLKYSYSVTKQPVTITAYELGKYVVMNDFISCKHSCLFNIILYKVYML